MNKTDFHIKGFGLGFALKQRRKATQKSPILSTKNKNKESMVWLVGHKIKLGALRIMGDSAL